MLVVRSIVFNILFYLTLLLLMVLGLPTLLGGRRGVFALANAWRAASVWLLEAICGLKVEYRGVENIPPGAVLIAAKHQSFLETFALLKYAPDFAIILKRQLTYIPFFGLYLIVSKQIAIDRARGRQALQQIEEAARPVFAAGRQVLIYPEGTRRLPGAPPRYKKGVAAIYAGNAAPCLPVALNTGLFWRRRGFLRRPGVAVIEYLPPIPPGLSREAFAARVQNDIEAACDRLNAEAVARDPSLKAVIAEGVRTPTDGRRRDLDPWTLYVLYMFLFHSRSETMLSSDFGVEFTRLCEPSPERWLAAPVGRSVGAATGFAALSRDVARVAVRVVARAAPAGPTCSRSIRPRPVPRSATRSCWRSRATTAASDASCAARRHRRLPGAGSGPRRCTSSAPLAETLEFHVHLLARSAAERRAALADLEAARDPIVGPERLTQSGAPISLTNSLPDRAARSRAPRFPGPARRCRAGSPASA